MAGRVSPRSTPAENLRIVLRAIPWRLLLLLPVLLVLAFPAFLFGTSTGQRLLPALTNYFYNLSGPPASPVPTPYPQFPTNLPQPGSILYTVQVGDSCDEILTVQMLLDMGAGHVPAQTNQRIRQLPICRSYRLAQWRYHARLRPTTGRHTR